MEAVIEQLKSHQSSSPSRWREEAEGRIKNREWLRYSQQIAMLMLDRMEELGMTQKELALRMGCSQQYISKVLKGRENLSLETLYKIESALDLSIVSIPELCIMNK